jgi:hypothetical protein
LLPGSKLLPGVPSIERRVTPRNSSGGSDAAPVAAVAGSWRPATMSGHGADVHSIWFMGPTAGDVIQTERCPGSESLRIARIGIQPRRDRA